MCEAARAGFDVIPADREGRSKRARLSLPLPVPARLALPSRTTRACVEGERELHRP